MSSAADQPSYASAGFVLERGLLDDADLAPLEHRFLALANARTGAAFTSIHEPALLDAIAGDRDLEMYLYGEIRRHPELVELSLSAKLTARVRALLGAEDLVLLEKIPFRIDCPLVMRELAVWHQDHFYVKGDERTVTAWIPMQDTHFAEGCLLVMPGSHADGPVEHDLKALQKKHYPSSAFSREVRYVEMQRGDVLFFDACLLHSSGNNISDRIRYSVQARYLSADRASDPAMGERIEAP